jgi:TonB-dependent receptor
VSPYNRAYGDKDLQYTGVIRKGDIDIKGVLFGAVSRTWMRNTDDLYNFSADYKFRPAPWVLLGAGTFQQFKRRHFYRRVYTVNEGDLTGTADDYNTLPGYAGFINPDLIQFNRNNITEVWSDKYLRDDRTGLKVYDRTQGSDAYVGTEQNNAGYISFNLTPWNGKLEVYGGVRAEYNKQAIGAAIPAINSMNYTGLGSNINTPIYSEYGKLDWFPSISVNVKPNDLFVLRGGYSRTINRPEFRETSPFEELDYEGNQLIAGNPALRPSLSNNWDARLEFYPRDNQKGESVSIGFFYKSMTNPIERINTSWRVMESGSISNRISFKNAEKATIRGIEIEALKSLDFIPVNPFKQLSVGLNMSFIKSHVRQDSVSVSGGRNVKIDRRLQGQAPFLMNAGLYYDNPGSGTKASLIYNMVGERIYAASIGYVPVAEIYGFKGGLYRGSLIELPRHILDLSITQRIAKGLQAKLSVQNLLNKAVEMAEDFNFTNKYEAHRDMKPEEYTSEDPNEQWREEGDNISSRFHPGRYFSLSVSYSF